MTNPAREGRLTRRTKETDIRLVLRLDDPTVVRISTGVGFFDHMLDALATHGRLGLELEARGDLHIDQHHLVEDVGIALGTALRDALGASPRIVRFASAYAPLDESLARAVIDISGRSYLHYGAELSRAKIGDFDSDLVEEFFVAFVSNARMALHLDLLRGKNAHHQVEAMFKAFAIALRTAVQIDETLRSVPSTKGTLDENDARRDDD